MPFGKGYSDWSGLDKAMERIRLHAEINAAVESALSCEGATVGVEVRTGQGKLERRYACCMTALIHGECLSMCKRGRDGR